MNFALSAEQVKFCATLRRFLSERSVSLEGGSADGFDKDLWSAVCQEMELLELRVPERYGGAGFGLVETMIAMIEMGRTLTTLPFAAAVFAIEAILRLAEEEFKARVLPGLVRGEQLAVLTIVGPHDLSAREGSVRASTGKSGAVFLDGTCAAVAHAAAADLFIVPAVTTADGDHLLRLYLVDAAAAGVSIQTAQQVLDLSRPVARLVFNHVAAESISNQHLRDVDLAELLDVLRVLLSAEMLGAAEACLESSVSYAKQRVQFGRAIGSFQAVKHKCAEMAVELDATRAAVEFAVMLADSGSGELATAALIAKAQAADAFILSAACNLQIHGGIGFTWEHPAHRYLRRAKADSAVFGSSSYHRALLADRVGI